MSYLITTQHHKPFFTEYFDSENFFNPDAGMIVYDLSNETYTTDGENWNEIETDHL